VRQRHLRHFADRHAISRVLNNDYISAGFCSGNDISTAQLHAFNSPRQDAEKQWKEFVEVDTGSLLKGLPILPISPHHEFESAPRTRPNRFRVFKQ
jgi:hypothetical protein